MIVETPYIFYLKFDLIPRFLPHRKNAPHKRQLKSPKKNVCILGVFVSPGWQYKTRGPPFYFSGTVDSEIPNSQPPGMVLKPCKSWGFQLQLYQTSTGELIPDFWVAINRMSWVGNPSFEWSPMWHRLTCGGDRSGVEFVELPREMLTPGAQGGLDGLGVGVFFLTSNLGLVK